MDVQVVGEAGESVKVGAEGEVVVESRHLTSTYWADPDLTARKFQQRGDGVVRYHTGDIGRMSADGTLSLLGRSDDVVKIGGLTVHLGAVEEVILAQPRVTGAMVWSETVGTEERLIAEVTCVAGAELDKRGVRTAIMQRLPRAAVPELRQVEELPFTETGKMAREK